MRERLQRNNRKVKTDGNSKQEAVCVQVKDFQELKQDEKEEEGLEGA